MDLILAKEFDIRKSFFVLPIPARGSPRDAWAALPVRQRSLWWDEAGFQPAANGYYLTEVLDRAIGRAVRAAGIAFWPDEGRNWRTQVARPI